MLKYICNQGTVGVSRPEGKLPGVPFLTLEAPYPENLKSSLTNKLKSLHNFKVLTYIEAPLFPFYGFICWKIHDSQFKVGSSFCTSFFDFQQTQVCHSFNIN